MIAILAYIWIASIFTFTELALTAKLFLIFKGLQNENNKTSKTIRKITKE